jgi:anti-sigma regulatory factor (Ser/Thr protein kinase)
VGDTVLLNRQFDRDAITETRHGVAACAAGAGLAGPRLEAFVLAINEIVTNAVRHGGGSGRIRLWRTAAGLGCEISDAGPGAPPERFNGHGLPPTTATGGRGLWLARRLCDTFDVKSGGTGTAVHMTMRI